MKNQGLIKLISSVNSHKQSKLELNILPDEKTPWHYHTLFSETFEVLKGTLEVGKGKNVLHLNIGDIATIEEGEKHYYHNVSDEECVITVTIDPGNKNFENALFILKGLAEDGFASNAGTPKSFLDLVLFVYLSNSKMVGFKKVAEPLFNFFAKIAIRNGRLSRLIERYCN
ncbi:quercetin dioxygenase-like cupin family protein [Mucilaginibacter sp. UYP25]|uniref:cupin domain-containing protein n=1 Tax=unclassified Mucilaginibacter TaxID=2617802 RepID=UPI003391476A